MTSKELPDTPADASTVTPPVDIIFAASPRELRRRLLIKSDRPVCDEDFEWDVKWEAQE